MVVFVLDFSVEDQIFRAISTCGKPRQATGALEVENEERREDLVNETGRGESRTFGERPACQRGSFPLWEGHLESDPSSGSGA